MKLKKIWLIALLGIFILIIGPKLVGIEESLEVLRKANFLYIFLIIASLLLQYISAAFINRIILYKIGRKLPFLDNLRLAMMGVFAIHLLPVGTLGGATLELLFLKKRKFSNSQILLAFVLRTIYIYMMFGTIFLASALFINPQANLSKNDRTVIYIVVATALFCFTYLIYVYRKEKLYHKRFKQFFVIYNKIKKVLKRTLTETESAEKSASDIYKNTHKFTHNWRVSVPILLWSAGYWLGDILCLYFALKNFGYTISPQVLIFTYCVSSILSIASFVPGGIGVMEASLSLIMIGLGVPSAVAVISVLLYRFFAFWLLIPLGAWAFGTLARGNNSH